MFNILIFISLNPLHLSLNVHIIEV